MDKQIAQPSSGLLEFQGESSIFRWRELIEFVVLLGLLGFLGCSAEAVKWELNTDCLALIAHGLKQLHLTLTSPLPSSRERENLGGEVVK